VDPIKALLLNGQGELWIRTQNRLGIVDTNQIEGPIWQDPGIPAANLFGAPTLDRSGNLLLPTSQGLFRRSGGGWEVVTRNSGLTSSAVFSALEDREGNIWVGLAGAGLDRIPGSRQWWGWTESEGLPDSLVLGALRDHQSRLWVGTNNGLAMWNDALHRWQTWSTTNGLPGSGIHQLALGSDGSVWSLSLQKGLVRFDPSDQSLTPERVPLKIGDWHANSISIAPDGSVWTDGSKSLHRVERFRGQFITQDVAIPPEVKGSTDVVAFSADGVLWTGGENGLSRLANGKWSHYTVDDGLLNNSIRRLSVNSDGSVWIGYGDEDSSTKVSLVAGGKLKVSNLKQAVCALGEDKEKNTWFELDKGVGVLSATGNFQTFTENDGLLWNDVNCNAFWQEADGSILIGTSRGLSHYDPSQVPYEAVPPELVLTSIKFGKQEHVEDKDPRIEYSNRSFVAEFSTLFFQNKSRLACRYRLRNLETEWSDTKLREIRYTSLPPGGYTLEVNCGSPKSGWAKQPISYAFFIAPPWWQTWWAETAGAGGLILLIWLFVTYHIEAQHREKARLEAAVAERSAELAKANRELKETSFRDPLTGVYNRRFFHTTISADASAAIRAYSTKSGSYSRDHRDLIFFLLDLDHFKHINDTYGHDAGDQVLMEVAARLNEVVRKSDFLIRWGGEEFMIVCRAAQRDESFITARRILTSLSDKPFQVGKDGTSIVITCSIGWAAFPWSQHEPSALPVTEVIKLADRGLYLAKQRGRNRAIGSMSKSSAVKTVSGCTEPQIEENELIEVPNP
jgi:diguanylate cyclase (GGDEF)-like protein